MKKYIPIIIAVFFAVLMIVGFSWKNQSPNFGSKAKVALRMVGHQLLLQSDDANTLVRPVIDLGNHTFELSFQHQLSIDPDSLVAISDRAIARELSIDNYLVEVQGCISNEVLYSYHIQGKIESNELACSGRKLPLGCYSIRYIFTTSGSHFDFSSMFVMGSLLIMVFLLATPTIFKRNSVTKTEMVDRNTISLGSYVFDIDQRSLIIYGETTELTSKEFELLLIFTREPNQVIERERLLKEVWEDKGVFVGRSLDVFISKLRKKLEQDDKVNIVNIRGRGYRLELA